MSLMGYREYARHRNCRLYAVQQAIKTNRISAAVNVEQKKIDSDQADQLWAVATDAAMQRKQPPPPPAPAPLPILEGLVEQAPPGLSRRPEWEVPFPPITEVTMARAIDAATANVVDGDTFMHWRTREQRANALAAERELDRQAKRSLDAGETLKAFATMGKMYRDGSAGVPSQLAPQLVGLTDVREIERRIRAAYRNSDQRTANEIRNRFSEIAGDAVAAG